MLWTLLLVLVVLWALGLLTGNALGGLIHILIVLAVIIFAIRLLSGRDVL